MSHFHISNDWRRNPNPTQAQLDAIADMLRQCRTDDDIRRDNAEAQRDYEQERQSGWSVR